MDCHNCRKKLERDEIALSYKLISRAARNCYCMDCLGKQFHLKTEQLQKLAEQFRQAGCTLFL